MDEHREPIPARASREHQIVVVSGLPRSGTSMAMRMLQAGGLTLVSDGVRVADENNSGGYFEDERVKGLTNDTDNSWIADARGKAIKVVSPLVLRLPREFQYKVIFMNRELREVLASQRKMLINRGCPPDTSDATMMRSFEHHLARIKEFLVSKPSFDALEVQYEVILRNPVDEARRISDFLGADLNFNAMAATVNVQMYQSQIRGT
jgi:hypothetical protein